MLIGERRIARSTAFGALKRLRTLGLIGTAEGRAHPTPIGSALLTALALRDKEAEYGD